MLWRIPAGILIRGPRTTKMFTLAVILTTVSPLMYYFATNPILLMIARIFHALGFALYVPTALGIVALLTPPEKRSIAIGKYTSAGASGLMMGPAIGSIGTRFIGLQNVFLLASLDACIGLVLVISVILPKIRQVIQEEDPPPPFHFREIPDILSKKPVIIAFLGYFSIVFIYGTNLAFTPLYAKEQFQLSEELVAGLFTGYFLLAVIVRVALGNLIRRWGTQKLLLFGLLNLGFMSLIMFIIKSSVYIFIGAFFVMGISHGLVFPIGSVFIVNSVKRSQIFLANSLYFFSFDLGGGIGPILTALIVTRAGIPPVYLLIAVIPFIVAFLAYYMRVELPGS